jgi:hypothetical protein
MDEVQRVLAPSPSTRNRWDTAGDGEGKGRRTEMLTLKRSSFWTKNNNHGYQPIMKF